MSDALTHSDACAYRLLITRHGARTYMCVRCVSASDGEPAARRSRGLQSPGARPNGSGARTLRPGVWHGAVWRVAVIPCARGGAVCLE